MMIRLNARRTPLLLLRYLCTKPPKETLRKWIEPESINVTPIEDGYFLVESNSYQFVIPRKVPHKLLYVHATDTPASILLKEAIHIIPAIVPEVNRAEKYQAMKRQLDERFDKNYNKCKTNLEVFQTERKVKIQMRNWYGYVGCISGKYKHHLLFKSLQELQGERTFEQYEKKGVKVDELNASIFPKGEVWMPTSNTYFQQFQKYISNYTGDIETCLDIGSGSGVLSYLMAKRWKKAKVVGVDFNPAAVSTFSINAASLQLPNAHCFLFDLKNQEDFEIRAKEASLPYKFDLIVINPPWLIANKLPFQGVTYDGVYDPYGKMLCQSLKLAKRVLKSKQSRILLIYSDISRVIGLEKKSVQDLCKENDLLIMSKIERPMGTQVKTKSPLNQIKMKSSMQLFEIKQA